MSDEISSPSIMLTQRRPRLLVIASTYPRWKEDTEPGFVHELCKRLTASFEVHVVCPHAPEALVREYLDGVNVHRFRYAPGRCETLVQGGGILSNLKFHPWKWALVPLFLCGLGISTWVLTRRISPACIHAHWIIPQGFVAGVLKWLHGAQAPLLLTSHGGDLFGLQGGVFTLLKQWVLRRMTALTVVSNVMLKEALKMGVPQTQIQVVPMGVDFSSLSPPENINVRKPGEILFVGRLVEKKGLRYLILALPIILERMPDAHLTVIGGGPDEGGLHLLVQELGLSNKVKFLGALPHTTLVNYYRRASVFVAPFVVATGGDREGLGLVTVEAIACGCPIIVGDLPVLDDVLEPAESDLRVDPRDAQTLANAVTGLLSAPDVACKRAMEIRTRLMSRFDWDVVANRYEIMLLAMCGRNVISSQK